MALDGSTTTFLPYTLNGLQAITADSQVVQTLQVNSLTPNRVLVSDGSNFVVSAAATSTEVDFLTGTTSNIQSQLSSKASITYVDTNFLSKTTSSDQTVASKVSYQKELVVAPQKRTDLAQQVIVDSNYQNLITSASVSVSQHFGTITNSGGVYQSTCSNNPQPVLLFFPITNGNRYRFTVESLIDDPVYGVSFDYYQSQDGVNAYPDFSTGLLDYYNFPPSSVIFRTTDVSFTALTTGWVVVTITTSNPSGIATLQWKNLAVYEMGVALQNVTMPTLTADRVAVFNEKKQLVASGINTTKLGYLDNVSSDLQTQINARLSLTGGTMTGTLDMGANKITTSYVPVNAEDLTRKGYVDSAISGTVANYLPLTGGTLSGALTVNNAVNVGTRLLGTPDVSPSGNFWIGLRGSASETDRLAIAIIGNITTGDVSSVNIAKPLALPNQTANRVLVLDGSNNVSSSSITTTTLGYLDASSSIQTQINARLSLTGGTMTGNINMGSNFVKCSSDPSANEDLTRKSYVDTLITGRIPRSGDTSLISDFYTTGYWRCAGKMECGGLFSNTNVGVNQSTPQWLIHANRTNTWNATTGGYNANKAGAILALGGKDNDPDLQYIVYPNPSITDGGVSGMNWWSSDMLTGRYKNEFRIAWWKETHGSPLGTAYKEGITMFLTDSGGYVNMDYIKLNGNTTVNGVITNSGSVSTGEIKTSGTNVINLGYDVTKEVNAGKIGYQTFTTGCLDIVGAGTVGGGSRKVRIYDSLGIGVTPAYTLDVSGDCRITSSLLVSRVLSLNAPNGNNRLDVLNNSGQYTHLGYQDGNNYIRGATTQFDTSVTLIPNTVTSNTTWNNTDVRLMFRNVFTGQIQTGACSQWSYRYPNASGWLNGLTIRNAFYVPNFNCSIRITFIVSFYVNVVQDYGVDCIIQPDGSPIAPPLYNNFARKFFNITFNHEMVSHTFVIPNNTNPVTDTIGWKQIYFGGTNVINALSDINDSVVVSITVIG